MKYIGLKNPLLEWRVWVDKMKHHMELREMSETRGEGQDSREMTREEALAQLQKDLDFDGAADIVVVSNAFFATLDIVDELRGRVLELDQKVFQLTQGVAGHTHDVVGKAVRGLDAHYESGGGRAELLGRPSTEPRAPQGWHRLVK